MKSELTQQEETILYGLLSMAEYKTKEVDVIEETISKLVEDEDEYKSFAGDLIYGYRNEDVETKMNRAKAWMKRKSSTSE